MMVVFFHLKDIADRAGPRSVQSGFREENTRWDFPFIVFFLKVCFTVKYCSFGTFL